jgi:hypothetical protein
MQIHELLPAEGNKQLGYDLKDDLMCFMHNDPTFYRKEYFPVIHKFKEYVEAGKMVNPRAFESLITRAYEQYQQKFPVEGLQPKLTKEMCEDLCKAMHEEETKHIEDGKYDES